MGDLAFKQDHLDLHPAAIFTSDIQYSIFIEYSSSIVLLGFCRFCNIDHSTWQRTISNCLPPPIPPHLHDMTLFPPLPRGLFKETLFLNCTYITSTLFPPFQRLSFFSTKYLFILLFPHTGWTSQTRRRRRDLRSMASSDGSCLPQDHSLTKSRTGSTMIGKLATAWHSGGGQMLKSLWWVCINFATFHCGSDVRVLLWCRDLGWSWSSQDLLAMPSRN